jgi:hypothetical protein
VAPAKEQSRNDPYWTKVQYTRATVSGYIHHHKHPRANYLCLWYLCTDTPDDQQTGFFRTDAGTFIRLPSLFFCQQEATQNLALAESVRIAFGYLRFH